jgi:hypothetical protein
LIGSDLVILIVSAGHVFKAAVMLHTTAADQTVPFRALLDVFGEPSRAAAALLLASALSLFGTSTISLHPIGRLLALVPQQFMLWITAIGALLATLHGLHQPCAVSPWYIGINQVWRIVMPLIYTAAIHARWRDALLA